MLNPSYSLKPLRDILLYKLKGDPIVPDVLLSLSVQRPEDFSQKQNRVFDPLEQIQGKNDMNEALLRVWTISPVGYTELTPPQGIAAVGQSVWLEGIGLGLNLWKGQFEYYSKTDINLNRPVLLGTGLSCFGVTEWLYETI